MATKTIYCLLMAVAFTQAQQVVDGKIKITTITTAGCGDTVVFIGQLNEAFGLYRDFLELEFIPWGRTSRNENGTLTCQFFERDCWANRVHRCALDILKDNQEAKMHYMNCEFTTPFPSFQQQSYLCAQALGLSLVDLDYCVSSSAGDHLDVAAETSAQQPMAEIDFVPAIVFNDDIDPILHNQAKTSLTSMLCFALAADPSTGVTNCVV